MYSRLGHLSKQFPGITVAVTLEDLREWSEAIVFEAKQELEQSIAEQKTEAYLSPKVVAERLEVDTSTLWRWKKKGYLVPVEIGGKRRYKQSDLNQLMRAGK